MTPFVLVDTSVLARNIARQQAAVSSCGAALRPHFKTHRTERIARAQLAEGAAGLTCATAVQLEAACGIAEQVLVSGPIQLDPATRSTVRRLNRPGVLFSAASTPALSALRQALGPEQEAQLLLELDVGCDRGGLSPEECGDVARQARHLGLQVTGALAYPGQGYVPGRQSEAAASERIALERAGASLERAGVAVRCLSAGSTPTMPYIKAGHATEFRPGTYVFGDVQQITLGAMALADAALCVIATVIAQRDGQVVLDAGAKALGRDRPAWVDGHGWLLDHGAMPVSQIYDHHAVVRQDEQGRPSFDIGAQVRVLPNNVNSAVALASRLWFRSGLESTLESIQPVCG